MCNILYYLGSFYWVDEFFVGFGFKYTIDWFEHRGECMNISRMLQGFLLLTEWNNGFLMDPKSVSIKYRSKISWWRLIICITALWNTIVRLIFVYLIRIWRSCTRQWHLKNNLAEYYYKTLNLINVQECLKDLLEIWIAIKNSNRGNKL